MGRDRQTRLWPVRSRARRHVPARFVGRSHCVNAILEQLKQLRIVPVIVIDDPVNAAPLAAALIAGGLPCAEITFRTPKALDALKRITAEQPDMFAGAGTVLTPEQAKLAHEAGARFVVAPGFNPRVV